MHTLTVNVLGSRLAAARRLRAVSQRKLAAAIGMSGRGSLISHFEAGRKLPSLRTLVAIALQLNVSADYLLGATPPIQVPGETGNATAGS